MKALHPCLLALGLAAAAVPFASADDGASTDSQDQSRSPSSVDVTGPTSHVSSALSAAITADLPKYQPPTKPKAAPAKPLEDPGLEEADADQSGELASDQPKNHIVRLPKYVVEGERPVVFREKDIYTKKGLAMLAMNRYLSSFDRNVLNRFTLPLFGSSAAQRAVDMYNEEQRLQDMADIKDQAGTAQRSGNSAEAKYLLKESDRTFLRSGGMDWTLPKNSSD